MGFSQKLQLKKRKKEKSAATKCLLSTLLHYTLVHLYQSSSGVNIFNRVTKCVMNYIHTIQIKISPSVLSALRCSQPFGALSPSVLISHWFSKPFSALRPVVLLALQGPDFITLNFTR